MQLFHVLYFWIHGCVITDSLNHVYDYRYFIQNYTYKPFGVVVKAGEEITLQYQFQVWAPTPDVTLLLTQC